MSAASGKSAKIYLALLREYLDGTTDKLGSHNMQLTTNNEQRTTDNEQKIRLFREIFRGRQDIVPKYWTSGKTGKSGYSPLCRNEWRPGCQKGTPIRGACSFCKRKEHIPLSDSLIYDHFTGKHILGVYPLLTDNTCYFIAADFDNHTGNRSPLDDAAAFYESCQVQDIPCYVLRSKSGKGYHAFIFF